MEHIQYLAEPLTSCRCSYLEEISDASSVGSSSLLAKQNNLPLLKMNYFYAWIQLLLHQLVLEISIPDPGFHHHHFRSFHQENKKEERRAEKKRRVKRIESGKREVRIFLPLLHEG